MRRTLTAASICLLASTCLLAVDARLAPRRPAVPSDFTGNPIDFFVEQYLTQKRIAIPHTVDDSVFARRVYFDLIGLPPAPAELAGFIADKAPAKRDRLIDELLQLRQQYAEHWMTLWNDLLRNEEGVAYPGEKREWITKWLLDALKSNMPYDRMVQALLHPQGPDAPRAWLAGINWGGDISASQSAAMQAAQNSAQVFLGANLRCASCHDSFVSRWKVAQTFALAAFFTDQPLEIARCEVKTGAKAQPAFLFPELAGSPPPADLPERRAQVAQLFTSQQNGRFARTLVNRYWKIFFGRGIVEPVDDIEARAWNADLLDWLASDFAEHDYDLQFLTRRILSSRTYQMASADNKELTFHGPLPRRLTAEQFSDAVSAITGEWKLRDDLSGKPAPYARQWQFRSDPLTRALGRQERFQVVTDRGSEISTLQALELVNGEEFRSRLQRGAKRLSGTWVQPPLNAADSGQVKLTSIPVEADITGAKRVWLLVTDFGSYDRPKVKAGWMNAEFVGPQGSVRLADMALPASASKDSIHVKDEQTREALTAPVPVRLVYDISGKGYTKFRALAGLDESGLRPEITAKVRFFVFTEKPGKDDLVRATGQPPVPRPQQRDSADLVKTLFLYAASREPSPPELAQATDMIRQGSNGVEDLLWVLFMSPEFQFIR